MAARISLAAQLQAKTQQLADSIEQQLADQSVHLAQIELDYTTQKQGEWRVTASRGRMPSETRR